ncbi:MAG: OmpA family protein [Bacteroidetes bacterium]|nr:OmpA family protein [Bacteroidota bacterium]
MAINENDTVFLEGFCDWRGSSEYNKELAKKRISAIENEIRTQLAQVSHIVFIQTAFGEEFVGGEDTSAEGMQKNRRVDILVKKMAAPVTRTEVLASDTLIIGKNGSSEMVEGLKESLRTGKNLRINNLNFRPGLDIIVPQSEPVLRELLELMNSNPSLEIEIQGYVCCTPDGSDGPNNRTGGGYLSRDRAKAVYDYLVDHGIEESRMDYKGFGGSNKIYNPERTAADMNANRRVEIKILKY